MLSTPEKPGSPWGLQKTIYNIWDLSLHHLSTLVGTSTPMTMTTYFLEAAQFLKGKDGGAEEEGELVNFLPKKRCFWPKRALSKSSKKCVNCNKIVKVKAFKVFVPTFCAFTQHLPPCKWAKYITSEKVPSPKRAFKCPNAFRFCLKFAQKKTFLCPNKQVVPPKKHFFSFLTLKKALFLCRKEVFFNPKKTSFCPKKTLCCP